MKPSNPPRPGLSLCRLTLAALPLLLMGCASSSPPPACELLPLPAPPSMSTQQPQESYSTRAQRNIEQWQQRLMATQLMQQPAAQRGQ